MDLSRATLENFAPTEKDRELFHRIMNKEVVIKRLEIEILNLEERRLLNRLKISILFGHRSYIWKNLRILRLSENNYGTILFFKTSH